MSFPSAVKVETFARGKVELAEFNVDESTQLNNIQLSKLNNISKANILVCAVSRDDEVIIPDGNYVIKTGDHLYITGSHRDLTRFCLDIGIITKQIKKVMIIGGGKIAFYLAKQLSVLGMRVKIIENNTEHCKVLAKNYLLLQSLMQMVVMKKY